MKQLPKMCSILALGLSIFSVTFAAETVGVFADRTVGQIAFAASDVKKALEAKGFSVEELAISGSLATYANKKIVIGRVTDSQIFNAYDAQDGAGTASVPNQGQQGYALRTTTAGKLSYWVFGGGDDANGAMYGGLQVAENIIAQGFIGEYQSAEKPTLMNRGIKLNTPYDARSGTYRVTFDGTSVQKAIPHVWDMTFWQTWFDEMARNRYNVISLWSEHPFTSMIKMPSDSGFSGVELNDVIGLVDDKNTIKIKSMTIDQKIQFWKEVMSYARNRGFKFYLFNWNLFVHGAEGKYGITPSIKNAKTVAYMRKCMSVLFETYPQLDGFGITAGENMDGTEEERSVFLGETYGKGMADYAKLNPTRKLNFIHRWHLADFNAIKRNFADLLNLSNVTFEMSYKYSKAHMYSNPEPQWMGAEDTDALIQNNIKSWLTVRNDSFYYHDWADTNFAKAYIKGIIKKSAIPGGGSWFSGFYMGSDGYTPMRTFFSKNSVTQGRLEVQRQWMMFKLWGRLSYNVDTQDEVFKSILATRFPNISGEQLFTAWGNASSGFPKVADTIQGTLKRDDQWWPEACQQDNDDGFLRIADFIAAEATDGSKYFSIQDTVNGKTGVGMTNTYDLANSIENNAKSSLIIIGSMSAADNSDLGVTLNNIRAMSYLSMYYALKIRGATQFKAGKKTDAMNTMGLAYGWWKHYTTLMVKMYDGMDMQRTRNLPTFNEHDLKALKEYTDLGGNPNNLTPPEIPTSTLPIITSSATVNSTFNSAFIYKITASNSPTSYKAINLPTGLSLNGDTISGAFTSAGSFNFSVTATNGSGTSSPFVVNVLVAKATASLAFTAHSLSVIADGSPKPVSVTTTPGGLPVVITYTVGGNATTTAPSAIGVYAVSAVINHGNYQGSASAQLEIKSSSGGGTSQAPTTAPKANDTTSSTPTLSGVGPVGAKVIIYNGNNKIGETTVNGSGNWSYTVSPALATGSHQITFTITETGKTESGKSPAVAITVSSGNNTNIKINFQPEMAPSVIGYAVDSGKPFSSRGNGYSYGWSYDMSNFTRDRNQAPSPDQLKDTVILTQKELSKQPKWEIALPNGTYDVRVVAGDPGYFSSDINYSFKAEGTVILNKKPTSAARWVEDTDPVVVTDGRLTLENGASAIRNRLCFIEISLITGVSN